MAKVLLVEDDRILATNVIEWLKLENHLVEHIADGSEALYRLNNYDFDIVILDWMLPGLTGVDILKQYREGGGTAPILMLTGRKEIEDKMSGLDSGADDYLTKPFHVKELSARVRALLRRQPVLAENVLHCRHLSMDLVTHQVKKGEEVVHLLPREYALLEFLLKHQNQVFSAEALLDRVWKSSSDVSPESIRTYITRLRSKIDTDGEASLIQNVHGVGYKLS
jgi:DNA-binding response OmpR family regulator